MLQQTHLWASVCLLLLIVSCYGACVLCVMKHGDMAIHVAAYNGSLDVLQYFIAKAEVGVNVRGQVS